MQWELGTGRRPARTSPAGLLSRHASCFAYSRPEFTLKGNPMLHRVSMHSRDLRAHSDGQAVIQDHRQTSAFELFPGNRCSGTRLGVDISRPVQSVNGGLPVFKFTDQHVCQCIVNDVLGVRHG